MAETLDSFFAALCFRMGWEPAPWRINVLKTMARMEGYPSVIRLDETWNPLDTMHPAGAVGNWNAAGVKIYPNLAAGVDATARTLEQPNFTNLRETLRTQQVNQGTAADLRLWGWNSPNLLNTILNAMGGETTMTTPDTGLAQGVTGEPVGDVPLDFEAFWESLGPDDQVMLKAYLLPEVISAIAPTVTTTQQAYDVQDAQAQRDLDKYVAQVGAGTMSLNQALAEITREQAVTTRTSTMGQEQRAFWDMQLAPGTEHQPGFGPQGAIGALQQKRGAEFQPRPVTTVPSGALSAQANLQQAQQTVPQVPPMRMPQYPQLPPPSGMGQTQTTTTGGGFADDILKILGMGGQQATPGQPALPVQMTPEQQRQWEMIQGGAGARAGGLPSQLWPWGY